MLHIKKLRIQILLYQYPLIMTKKDAKAVFVGFNFITMDQQTSYQLSRLNRAEKYLNLPLTKQPATLEKILKRLKEIQQKYNLIV